jgi:CCR4-NOT transcription complex subunit 2
MTNEDISTLALGTFALIMILGTDLTALGLNLNGPDPIFPSFMSPFSENPSSNAEPIYNLPPCYALPGGLPSVLSKIQNFTDETLFYIFYAFPRDASQEAASQELYDRAWRYHKELKLWLSKDPSMETTIKGPGCERGVYIFFDPSTWSRIKKEFILYYDQIEERGMGEAGTVASDEPSDLVSSKEGESLSRPTGLPNSSVNASPVMSTVPAGR